MNWIGLRIGFLSHCFMSKCFWYRLTKMILMSLAIRTICQDNQIMFVFLFKMMTSQWSENFSFLIFFLFRVSGTRLLINWLFVKLYPAYPEFTFLLGKICLLILAKLMEMMASLFGVFGDFGLNSFEAFLILLVFYNLKP